MKTCLDRPLVRDAWLGGLLARPVFGLHLADVSSIDEALAELEPDSFVYTKVDSREVRLVHRLESAGFRLIDTNVVLEKPGGSPTESTTSSDVRIARPEDEEGVARVAREGFALTRFHLDPHIDPASADAVKEAWARNYFRGKRGDRMVVAAVDGTFAGFNLLLLGTDGSLTIDLIAVDERFRRRGLGAAMIRFAETSFPASIVRVGTQIANASSLRLYESLGFRIVRSQYVLHYHHRG